MIDPRERIRMCAFTVGDELFAIDIMRIREIVRPLTVTPVPQAPRGMEGLTTLRGEVLPVFDLRVRFELPSRGTIALPRARFLILRVGHRQLALAVDDVRDIIEVRREDIQLDEVFSGRAGELFVGVCPMLDRLGMLLNLHHLLSSEELLALDTLPELKALNP